MTSEEFAKILSDHGAWLLEETGGKRADLYHANLRGAIGNGREIKSMQCGTYRIVWTVDVLHIGCQQHPASDWWAFDDASILKMDGRKALSWWRVWKPILQTIIEIEK